MGGFPPQIQVGAESGLGTKSHSDIILRFSKTFPIFN